jgi:hypothetical protein
VSTVVISLDTHGHPPAGHALRHCTHTVKRGETGMGSALDLLLPAFAPVPYEILVQVLTNRRRDSVLRKSKRAPSTVKISPTNLLEEETGFTQQEWDTLLRDIRPLRQAVFEEMDPVVRQGRLTTAWLSQRLLAATPAREAERGRAHPAGAEQEKRRRTGVSRSTLSGWEERGLVEFGGRNSPDPDIAAALRIARLLDKRRLRNWLPTSMARTVDRALDAQELIEAQEMMSEAGQSVSAGTWLLCWRQDPPPKPGALPSPPLPCPIPLPPGLTRATVLVSPWQGLLWRPNWRRRINSLGVGRWYGAGVRGWDVTVEDLRGWIGETERLTVPHMETEAPDVLEELADIVLNRLGYALLNQLPAPSPPV